MNEPVYLTDKQQRKLDAWRRWAQKMTFLRSIHAEISHLKDL